MSFKMKNLHHTAGIFVLFFVLAAGILSAMTGAPGKPRGGWFMHAVEDTSQCLSANGGDFLVKNDGPDNVVVTFMTLDGHGIQKTHKVPLGKGDFTVVSGAVGRVIVEIEKKETECKRSNGTFFVL